MCFLASVGLAGVKAMRRLMDDIFLDRYYTCDEINREVAMYICSTSA